MARRQAEIAYETLSHRILILDAKPNSRIVEETWAKMLNVNRSAIREGLTRLLGEGMVYRGARGGFFVAEITGDELRELREVREILETAAATLACARVSAAQLDELKQTCDDFTDFVRKGYPAAAHDADFRFHRQLVAASGNTRLEHVYERSRIPLFHRKVANLQLAGSEDFELTDREHRAVVAALSARDVTRTINCLRIHFDRGMREALHQPADSRRKTPKISS